MEDSLSTIAALTKSGYGLTLYGNAFGVCWADLRRGWILRKHVRIDLDRDPTELLLTFWLNRRQSDGFPDLLTLLAGLGARRSGCTSSHPQKTKPHMTTDRSGGQPKRTVYSTDI